MTPATHAAPFDGAPRRAPSARPAAGSRRGRNGLAGAFVAAFAAACGPGSGADGTEADARHAHGAAPELARVERVVAAMGTELSVATAALDRPTALAAGEAAIAAVEAAEARLSNWDPSSEIERLARGALEAPSAALALDLAAFEPFVALTDGAFDPRAVASVVGADETTASGAPNTGGFGKGRALELAASAAFEAGAARVELSFGGQVLVRATDGAARPHTVRLADPAARERPVVAVDLPFDGAATSSQGLRRGHIVDPRADAPDLTGRGGSVTVFADDATAADALSTGLFVLGRERALAFARAHAAYEVLVIEPVGDVLRVHLSPGLVGRVSALADDVRLFLPGAAVERGPAAPPTPTPSPSPATDPRR